MLPNSYRVPGSRGTPSAARAARGHEHGLQDGARRAGRCAAASSGRHEGDRAAGRRAGRADPGPVPDGPADCSRGAGWRAARHAVRGAAAFVVVSLATVALDRDEGFRPSRERILVEGCALSGGCTVSERRALTASGAIRFF